MDDLNRHRLASGQRLSFHGKSDEEVTRMVLQALQEQGIDGRTMIYGTQNEIVEYRVVEFLPFDSNGDIYVHYIYSDGKKVAKALGHELVGFEIFGPEAAALYLGSTESTVHAPFRIWLRAYEDRLGIGAERGCFPESELDTEARLLCSVDGEPVLHLLSRFLGQRLVEVAIKDGDYSLVFEGEELLLQAEGDTLRMTTEGFTAPQFRAQVANPGLFSR